MIDTQSRISLQQLMDTIKKQTIAGMRMHKALNAIVAHNVHHPECVMDRCRQSCPVRVALETLHAPILP